MQIVIKGAREINSDLASQVRAQAVSLINGISAKNVRVTKVFPEAQVGQRARLYVLHLPDDLNDSRVEAILRALRSLKDLESASLPSPRRPI
ncbi:MAG: hypothetical protein QOF78_3896 [Phycisphaerales bacterium]|jgi:hypothetical protein|nr:hypothetical protein [Phycisphaerales bacterium]